MTVRRELELLRVRTTVSVTLRFPVRVKLSVFVVESVRTELIEALTVSLRVIDRASVTVPVRVAVTVCTIVSVYSVPDAVIVRSVLPVAVQMEFDRGEEEDFVGLAVDVRVTLSDSVLNNVSVELTASVMVTDAVPVTSAEGVGSDNVDVFIVSLTTRVALVSETV